MWEQRFVQTERGRFEVYVKGNGPPLCVTHLYSEFNESGDYFADGFTKDHTVYLVNLKDAGNSDSVRAAYEYFMFETVFDLESIREALQIKRWVFAGHSTGGMLGCLYGIHASRSLDALLMVGAAAREYATSSSACIYHIDHPNHEMMQQFIERLKDPNLEQNKRQKIAEERTKLSLYRPDDYRSFFSKPIHKKMSAARMNFFAREILQFDVTKQLHVVNTPTFIACGRFDVQCPLPFSEEMANFIPLAQLVIFEESNHYPFLEEKVSFELSVQEFMKNNHII
ncbi:alpha/beta fold hydrolase [Bacillus sp. RAR_GA_16]|uniref:alpha/beta fold hydrolase n=1 Tax=Bacillus sp. RAR_GA_16 TaxID=2876774 RepID=UPI001CCB89D9|nr:alpha/beta hydrolase [Bacillus sp. RAR_GA_16]MCA0171086.1 alpha/beta hydrolase [Bacillus sp. RAR_GA_16]